MDHLIFLSLAENLFMAEMVGAADRRALDFILNMVELFTGLWGS